MINVTKTFLPPKEDYIDFLNSIWSSSWVTNRGPLVLQLEHKLKAYLGVPNIIATTNGTLPIQIAIKALELKGEIITTPFSYVATTSSIVWEGCDPVFVDIHPEYLTIDETKIEEAITPKTSGILATHVFGNPCNVEVIGNIAKKYNLKVIYDAAHSFGVTYKGTSIFNKGDVSTCSFHATKLFHTGEGGGIFTQSKDLNDKLFYHHNFGHQGSESFQGLGVNGKMSELQAAMGLSVLPYMSSILKERKKIVKHYTNGLENTSLKFLKIREGTEWNYSYFPVIFKNESQLQLVKNKLEEQNVFSRRYFYPSLNRLPYINRVGCTVSDLISKSVLCLPLYHGLCADEVDQVINVILKNI